MAAKLCPFFIAMKNKSIYTKKVKDCTVKQVKNREQFLAMLAISEQIISNSKTIKNEIQSNCNSYLANLW